MPPNLGNAGLLGRMLDEKAPPSPSGMCLSPGRLGGQGDPCNSALSPVLPPLGLPEEPGMVRLVCGHHNWIAVAYTQFLVCYRCLGRVPVGGRGPCCWEELGLRAHDVPPSSRLKEASGWQLVFSSPRLDWPIERLALTARVLGGALGEHDKMVAAATGNEILLWALQAEGGGSEIGMAQGFFQNPLPLRILPQPVSCENSLPHSHSVACSNNPPCMILRPIRTLYVFRIPRPFRIPHPVRIPWPSRKMPPHTILSSVRIHCPVGSLCFVRVLRARGVPEPARICVPVRNL